ncbi:hypothetical protein GcM3_075025 [Golovinomyces cichoracearum]|uniref:Uncharacterized protein n=1 Tax=Golovinomyces cichoracearum TaxID=62708 RepID=A0A420IR61_9PEZI|nr:hypothetical protein GcM3_075025 [Golovinomyces cichoracearum]
MHRFCFILLVARSSHNHHPPYPIRLPKDIKEQVQEMLRSVDILATSSRRLLVCPVYTQMCSAFGDSRLSRLHASLGVQDRLTALIREERLYQYPARTDFAGVSREFQLDRLKDSEKSGLSTCSTLMRSTTLSYAAHMLKQRLFKR